jgi:hypothetical protein
MPDNWCFRHAQNVLKEIDEAEAGIRCATNVMAATSAAMDASYRVLPQKSN